MSNNHAQTKSAAQKSETNTLPKDVYYDDIEQCYFKRLSNGDEVLHARPDGKCYCGVMRNVCGNFVAYGKDCQGFSDCRGYAKK